jgi:hypothetical protein
MRNTPNHRIRTRDLICSVPVSLAFGLPVHVAASLAAPFSTSLEMTGRAAKCTAENQGAAVSSPPSKKSGLETAPPLELVSKILEICGDAKVSATDELNHCLQIVFLLSRNSNLSILQLALHLETF